MAARGVTTTTHGAVAVLVGAVVLALVGCTGGGDARTPGATGSDPPSTSGLPGSASGGRVRTATASALPAGITMTTVLGDPWSEDSDVHAVTKSAIKVVDGAPKGATVTAAIFNLTYPDFEDALIRAYERGVNVRVVVNEETKSQRRRYDALKRQLADRYTGLDFEFEGRGGSIRMHSKFVLASTSDGVDDVVWVSSGNMTRASGEDQANEALVITGDSELYAFLAEQFELIFRGVEYPPTLGRSATTPTATVQAYPIPQGGEENDPVSALLKDITCVVDGRRSTVRLAHLYFTDDRLYIANRLRELKSQGCDVRVAGHVKQWGKARDLLVEPGSGQVDLYSSLGAAIHTKLLVIDGWDAAGKPLKIAMVGSHNLTGRALTKIPEGANDEISITVTDPGIVGAYTDWVDWMIENHSAPVFPVR